MSRSKRYLENAGKVDIDKLYNLEDALDLIESSTKVKFDQTIDLSINLGVDPRHADQVIRGTVSLPHGTGKNVKVLVIAKGDKADEALAAGADYAGDKEYLDKIKGGWTDIDIIISTPDMMAEVGKLGRILGPKKLMPNPKSGTVTPNVKNAVTEVKKGKIEYRVDKNGIIHTIIGKSSFDKVKLSDNCNAIMNAIIKAKPSSLKGIYLKKITLSSTMGPGIKLDKNIFIN
ncbi:50S ribosomal protein L1 [bacterium]|nr:MAG: 50S ribosomal protein L1 [bacterium]|tara:strand:+ start:1060 stop:1752 length:693 start_codon:yes stop_codon:yes gene_type:complete